MSLNKVEKQGKKYKSTLLVKQTQDGEAFIMPVDVLLKEGMKEKLFDKVLLKGKEQELTFVTDFSPGEAVIDPDGMMLKEVTYK